MKVGILNAIPVDPSGLDWGEPPTDRYTQFLRESGADFEIVGYMVAEGELPASPDACDAYIITGSPRGVYDSDPWIATLDQFLRESYVAGKKLVGICFGHQILANSLGGRAEKSARGMGLGLMRFNMLATKPWMDGLHEESALYFAHQDQVEALPPGAERLAGSEFCPNAMFVIGGQVLGLQGHPEFSAGLMRQIVERQDDSTPNHVKKAALDSLEKGQPDAESFGQTLVNFLVAP